MKSPILPPAKGKTTGGTSGMSSELQKRFQKRKALQGEGEECMEGRGWGGGRDE